MEMASSNSCCFFLGLLLLLAAAAAAAPSLSSSSAANNNTFQPRREIIKYRRIRAHLRRLNRPSLKTIQSPDGDTIDCVPSQLQPAFDHPRLKGHKPLEPPPRPRGHNFTETADERFQLWMSSGESCPEGTIPIRRTKEEDILRASSVRRFGRKPAAARVRRDSGGSGHEHAVGYVVGDQYYGAKASLNVWAPRVTSPSEFSLSQIWVIAGSFGNDLNTIEALEFLLSKLQRVTAPRNVYLVQLFFSSDRASDLLDGREIIARAWSTN